MHKQPIQTKEEFLGEAGSLMRQLEESIGSLAQATRLGAGAKPTGTVNSLNSLKIYDKQLRDLFDRVKNTSEEHWHVFQPKARELFNSISRKWEKFSPELRPAR